MKRTIQNLLLLLLSLTQLGVPAFAIDDAKLSQGDQLPYEDVPAAFPKSQLETPTQIEMGGFVFDNLHGKGPERDDRAVVANARESEREAEQAKALKIRKKVKAISRQVASKPKKATKRKASTYEMKMKAEFWQVTSFSGIFSFNDAHARGLSSTDRNLIRFQAQKELGRPISEQELDTIIGAMGGQGGEGSGSGGGGGASESLFAVAAIIAAASPAVVAAIQASADKSIAQTNADAQVAMTAMASETSMYIGKAQADTAITQTLVARDINKNNQESETERLGMQLASLADARKTSSELDMMKTRWQFQLDLMRIQLAKEQSDATTKLAQMQLRLQMSQAGMMGGPGQSSLTVTRRNNSLTPTFYSGNFGRAQATNTSLASGKLLQNANATTRPATLTTNTRRAVQIDSSPSVAERAAGNPWDAAYNAKLQRSLASETAIPAARRNMTPLAGDASPSEGPSSIGPGSRHRQPGASPVDAGL